MKSRGLIWLVVSLATLVALAGLPRLTEDGQQAFRLEPDSPLAQLTARLVEETGGDRLVLTLLRDEDGILDSEGLAAIEEVRKVMASEVGLTRVQAVNVLPVLESIDGTLTGLTPLNPPPTNAAAWQDARSRVLGDPLLRGQFISEDGRSAIVIGWIAPGDVAEVVAKEAQQALHDEGFRLSPAGQRIQQEINEARMAVVLGEVAGSPQQEVARRLDALLAHDGPGAEQVAAWQRYGEQLQKDPDGAVLASLESKLAASDGGDVTELRLFSPRLLQDAYSEVFRDTVAAFLAVLLLTLFWFVARRRGFLAAALAVLLCTVCGLACLGASSWLGLALHPLTVFAAISSVLWLAALLLLCPGSLPLRLLAAGLLGAPVLLALPGGPGLSDLRLGAACGLAIAWLLSEAWASLPLRERSAQEQPSVVFTALSGLSVPWAWLVILLCCCAMLLGKPMGQDAGRLVAAQHRVGETAALLGASAFLVLEGAPGDAVQPETLRKLAEVQQQVKQHPAVQSLVSWADFISRLHTAVSRNEAGVLPAEASLVEQYLLLFDRPESTRMFVSEDLSMAVGVLRMEPGAGAELAQFAEWLPAGGDGPALAGEAVKVAVAVRRQARGLVLGMLLWSLVLVVGLLRMRSRGASAGLVGGSLAVPWVASALALAGGAYMSGSVDVMGALGAAWVLGALGSALVVHALKKDAATYDVFQLLVISALPLAVSLAMPLRAMGVGVVVSVLLAAFLFDPGDGREGAGPAGPSS